MNGSDPLYRGRAFFSSPRLPSLFRAFANFLPPLKDYLAYLEGENYELTGNLANSERLIEQLSAEIVELNERISSLSESLLSAEEMMAELDEELNYCQARLDYLQPKPVEKQLVCSSSNEDDIPF